MSKKLFVRGVLKPSSEEWGPFKDSCNLKDKQKLSTFLWTNSLFKDILWIVDQIVKCRPFSKRHVKRNHQAILYNKLKIYFRVALDVLPWIS